VTANLLLLVIPLLVMIPLLLVIPLLPVIPLLLVILLLVVIPQVLGLVIMVTGGILEHWELLVTVVMMLAPYRSVLNQELYWLQLSRLQGDLKQQQLPVHSVLPVLVVCYLKVQ
jgi:hypothetical protein